MKFTTNLSLYTSASCNNLPCWCRVSERGVSWGLNDEPLGHNTNYILINHS